MNEWQQWMSDWADEKKESAYVMARAWLKKSALSENFATGYVVPSILRSTCEELREEFDLEPGVPPLWCMVVGAAQEAARHDIVAVLKKYHYDLKNLTKDGGPESNTYDVYLSYSKADNMLEGGNDRDRFGKADHLWITGFGNALSGCKRKLGTDHLLAEILPEEYQDMMLPILRQARHYVLVLSPDYLDNKICQWEMETILALAICDPTKKVVIAERKSVVNKPAILTGTSDDLCKRAFNALNKNAIVTLVEIAPDDVIKRAFDTLIQTTSDNDAGIKNAFDALVKAGRNELADQVRDLLHQRQIDNSDFLPLTLWDRHNAWFPLWHVKAGEYSPLDYFQEGFENKKNSEPDVFSSIIDDIRSFIDRDDLNSREYRKIVYLCEVPRYLEPRRQQLQRQLFSLGMEVLPLKSLNPMNLPDEVQQVLVNAQLCIQLAPPVLALAETADSNFIRMQRNETEQSSDIYRVVWHTGSSAADAIPDEWKEWELGIGEVRDVAERADKMLSSLADGSKGDAEFLVLEPSDDVLKDYIIEVKKLSRQPSPRVLRGLEQRDALHWILRDCQRIYTVYNSDRDPRQWAETWLEEIRPVLVNLDSERKRRGLPWIKAFLLMVQPRYSAQIIPIKQSRPKKWLVEYCPPPPASVAAIATV